MKSAILGLCAAFLLSSCVVVKERMPGVGMKRGGPPPWAPAHGHRAKHAYHYYPASGVYFNVSTGMYFYLGGGSWQISATLPSAIVIDSHDFVTLELESDRPYIHYKEHKAKFPGKKHKKHTKKNWKKRGK
ncbi:MAG: hypothetical protein IH803_06210 [Nitrospirae bacterium]|nr:hypothetical protein [Nitrospirota bacterium]